MEQTNSSRREVLHQLANLYSHINRTADAVRYIQLALDTCTPADLTCAPIHAFHGDLAKDMNDLDSAILVSFFLSLSLSFLLVHTTRGKKSDHHFTNLIIFTTPFQKKDQSLLTTSSSEKKTKLRISF